jgi:L-2-hydroxyglutarate oxidase
MVTNRTIAFGSSISRAESRRRSLMQNTDVIVIGGGIVGLATAFRLLQRFPNRKLILLEKEDRVAAHQTGHNSGVLHSGIYYRPGSLKASNCRTGKMQMEHFCLEYGIPIEICGKVIVATEESELISLEQLFRRGQSNGVSCRMIDPLELQQLEPFAAGVAAIHVEETGIVDYVQVAHQLAELVDQAEGIVKTSAKVVELRLTSTNAIVVTDSEEFEADLVINCAGLQSDRIAKIAGIPNPARIVPFRGEYFRLKSDRRHLCRNLIYPVPDPSFPFLGVHLTRGLDGNVECGPNAVLAFAREGYQKRKIDIRDLAEILAYPGFRRLAKRNFSAGLSEFIRSFSKSSFTRSLQRLVPSITRLDLESAPAGVRAQAVLPDGQLVDDFLIVEHERMINVINAPSPAATASLNIGETIVDTIGSRLQTG